MEKTLHLVDCSSKIDNGVNTRHFHFLKSLFSLVYLGL